MVDLDAVELLMNDIETASWEVDNLQQVDVQMDDMDTVVLEVINLWPFSL